MLDTGVPLHVELLQLTAEYCRIFLLSPRLATGDLSISISEGTEGAGTGSNSPSSACQTCATVSVLDRHLFLFPV